MPILNLFRTIKSRCVAIVGTVYLWLFAAYVEQANKDGVDMWISLIPFPVSIALTIAVLAVFWWIGKGAEK